MKTCSAIGDSLPIRDAELKVTGRKQYVGDMRVPGILHEIGRAHV